MVATQPEAECPQWRRTRSRRRAAALAQRCGRAVARRPLRRGRNAARATLDHYEMTAGQRAARARAAAPAAGAVGPGRRFPAQRAGPDHGRHPRRQRASAGRRRQRPRRSEMMPLIVEAFAIALVGFLARPVPGLSGRASPPVERPVELVMIELLREYLPAILIAVRHRAGRRLPDLPPAPAGAA